MPAPRSTAVPRLPVWLTRLAADDEVLMRMQRDPVLFASWYAMGSALLPWPEAVEEIQRAQQAKKLSLERSLSLLDKLGRADATTGMSTYQVRAILEGYAVHEWAEANWEAFKNLVKPRVKVLETLLDNDSNYSDAEFSRRVSEFSEVLSLNPVESKVVTLAFVCALHGEFNSFLDKLMAGRRSNVGQLFLVMLGCTEAELRAALSPTGVLRTSRVLQTKGDTFKLPVISDFWVSVLANPLESVFDSLLKPLIIVSGAGVPASLGEADLKLAVDILVNSIKSQEMGVNLLMYGADGYEKRSVIGDVLSKAQKQGYVLRDFENAWGELPSITYVAQRLLFSKKGIHAVLVVEKPSDVLERKPSEFWRTMLGLELDSGQIAPLDQLLLDTNPVPTVWAGPGSASLLEESVARFVFHAPLKKAGKAELRAQLERYVAGLKLNKGTTKALLALEDVSAKQLETAKRAAALSGAQTKKETEEALVLAVRRSLSALKRPTSPKSKESVTTYSLEYLNYAGKFGPDKILKALNIRPKGSLCLYGPPGTGKTQFVEYLAQQLGRRLIQKRASDLLSKYVGENEKNIAAMFQEAEDAEAILFLDEADSFLRDRNKAGQAWEVTQVNELLQLMERFDGIFIVATNLFKGLDTAALRRFTFKMELRSLTPEQRWDMFLNEAGLKNNLGSYTRSQKDTWRAELYQLPQLAAGDFATVKRQCILLDEVLTPDQWVEQLQLECSVKEGAGDTVMPKEEFTPGKATKQIH